MPKSKRFLIFLSIILISPFPCRYAFPLELKTKYFTANIQEEIDTYKLLRKLDLKYFLHLDKIPPKDTPDKERLLEDNLDALYLAVSDILGIHMYSFQISLEILPDKRSLDKILKEHLDRDIADPLYYYKEKNTVYISFEDLTIGMLAHEIAHAIISHYFIVTPPPNTQEILSGYVEYSINKAVESGD